LQEGMNEELENSLGRSSAGSASQVKTWVSLKVGCLERMTQFWLTDGYARIP